MKRIVFLIGFTMLLAACGSASSEEALVGNRNAGADAAPYAAVDDGGNVANEALEVESDSSDGQTTIASNANPSQQVSGIRMIIKNGELTVRAEDIDLATENAIQTIIDYGGYIISQHMNSYGDGASRASLRFGVPAHEFEAAMRSLRALGEVSMESASGQDVTDEYVDLNSQLENLELTQLRLRTFLDEADTTEEALRVHQELRKVEGEIATIQGRINYLQDRTSFSTISLELTSDSAPIALGWQPGATVSGAFSQLKSNAQDAIDFGLYYGIVCLPWLLALGLVAWAVRRLSGVLGWRAVRRQTVATAASASENSD